MSLTNFLETEVLDHVFGGNAYTAPTTLYFALFTAAPSDTGGGTEVSGTNYTRVSGAFTVSGNTAMYEQNRDATMGPLGFCPEDFGIHWKKLSYHSPLQNPNGFDLALYGVSYARRQSV